MRNREDIKNEALAGLSEGSLGAAIGLSAGAPAFILGKDRMTQSAGKPTLKSYEAIEKLLHNLLDEGGYPADREINLDVRKGLSPNVTIGKLKDKLDFPTQVSPQVVAHEAGHLTPGSTVGKVLQRAGSVASARPWLAVPSALAMTGLSENMEPVAKAAPWVGGALLAATLGEEARANIRGAKLLEAVTKKMPISQKIRL